MVRVACEVILQNMGKSTLPVVHLKRSETSRMVLEKSIGTPWLPRASCTSEIDKRFIPCELYILNDSFSFWCETRDLIHIKNWWRVNFTFREPSTLYLNFPKRNFFSSVFWICYCCHKTTIILTKKV